MVARGKRRQRVGKMGAGGQEVQTSSYKINKLSGCNIPHGNYSQEYCIAYLKSDKRINLKKLLITRKKNL